MLPRKNADLESARHFVKKINYIYICIYVYIYIYLSISIHVSTYMHLCIHYMHTYMNIYICIYVCDHFHLLTAHFQLTLCYLLLFSLSENWVLGLGCCTLSPAERLSCRCIFPSSSSRIFPCSYHQPLTLSLMQQLLADTAPQLQPVALPAFAASASENKGVANPAESLVQNARTFWESAANFQNVTSNFLSFFFAPSLQIV